MTKNPAYGNTFVNATLFANIAKQSVMIGLREYAPCGVSLASSSHLSSSTRIVVTSSSSSLLLPVGASSSSAGAGHMVPFVSGYSTFRGSTIVGHECGYSRRKGRALRRASS